MSAPGKLRITWSKRERDVMIHYPNQFDGHYAHQALTEPIKVFLDEMERRGYERSSFSLSIKRKAVTP